jgi:hypothetical protein
MSEAGVKIAILLAVVVGLFGAGYLKGNSDGRVDQLQDSVEAFENRGEVDDEVGNLDDRALCIRLGGVPEQCDELRRLAEAAGK